MLEAVIVVYNLPLSSTDPNTGPQTSGWKQYDPDDSTTLALLGYSLTGAEPGDHFTADSTCDFWNQVVPIYPEVSVSHSFVSVTDQ